MGLTAKQELFCQLAASGSYADAYRTAYDVQHDRFFYNDIDKLIKLPQITRRICDIQAAAAKPVANAREFLIEWHWLRMTYDPAELSRWLRGACRHCHGEGGAYQWRIHEFQRELATAERDSLPLPDIAGGFGYNATVAPRPDCDNCDGKGLGRTDFSDTRELTAAARAAFEGVKQTKDGVEIRMADKQKAAESFAKLCGLDVVQVRSLVEQIPDAEELARLRADPDAAARMYARVIAGGSGRTIN